MDSTKSISSSATRFLSGSFLSRLTGMARDMTMAYAFGTSSLIAAFMISYRFAYLMRRLLGESPLSGSFIPQFEKIRNESEKRGSQFFLEFFFSLFILLLGVVALGELLLGSFLPLFSGENQQIVKWTMLMLPGLLFVTLYGLTSSFLQCQGRYFLPGIAPALFNLIWIGGTWIIMKKGLSISYLAGAVVLGLFFQWVFIWPKAASYIKEHLSLTAICEAKAFSKRVRQAALPFALGIMGVAASQINAAVDSIFARFASSEGPAVLWYAIRVQQIPVALIGVAYAAALLPALSRATAENFQKLLSFAFSRAFSLCMMMLMLILSVGVFGINLVYGRGEFTHESARLVSTSLWAYSIGLIPMVFSLFFIVAYQAMKDYKTPTKIAFISIFINIILNALMIFGFHFGVISVALATSISSFGQLALLYYYFPRKNLALFKDGNYARVSLASMMAFCVTAFVGIASFGGDGFFTLIQKRLVLANTFLGQLQQLLLPIAVYAVSLLLFGWTLKVKEMGRSVANG